MATVYVLVCTTNPQILTVTCCIHRPTHPMSKILFSILNFLDSDVCVVMTLIFLTSLKKCAGHVHFCSLPPSISHRRLPNSLFVLFNLLLLLLSFKNITFMRRANEVRGDQGKVFICVPNSRCFREDCIYRSIVDKHCSGRVEHSL